jgi:methylphosphotriester-DNA--protein-cysteine methyltransferase
MSRPREGPVLYREIAPPPDLAPFVECFWISEVESDGCQRILPDGCLDILFFSRGNELVAAQVVGAMTRFQDVRLSARESILGVRFQPGMAGACLACEIPSLNDRTAPLEAVVGRAARTLLSDLGRCSSTEARVEKLAPRLVTCSKVSEVQHAIAELVRKQGHLSVSGFANAAGLGDRQLRRAWTLLRAGANDFAGLAVDCGYYDQAHLIRDFRELAGLSPAKYLRQLGG